MRSRRQPPWNAVVSIALTLLMLAGLVHASTGSASAQSASNRDLRSLTVDGVSVANFSASRTTYEFGVDADQVTIVATAANSSATVTYSGTDQDSNTAGHQLDLSDGANAVTITVSANSQTKTYTLNVNRSVRSRGGWKADEDLDSLLGSGNRNPVGIHTDGTTMWAVDNDDDKIYAYNLSTGARDSSKDIDLNEHNDDPEGIWSNGTTMYVADDGNRQIYAYTLSTGERDSTKGFSLFTGTGRNNSPRGIWSNGSTMWVADSTANRVFAYNLNEFGSTQPTKNITLASGNGDARGIWSDGRTMWVADSADDMLYGYWLGSGNRSSGRDINNLDNSGNASVRGVTGARTTIWTSDTSDDKLYAYNRVSISDDSSLSSITVNGAEVAGLRAGETTQFGVAHDVSRVTIRATASHSESTVVYSVEDLDRGASGLQRDIAQGPDADNSLTITVTANIPGHTTEYTLQINRGYSDAYRWKAADDFDGLLADDVEAESLWSDGTTMWVLDESEDKVFAYTVSTRLRDTGKEFDLHSSNGDAKGIWSDGTTMWVADSADDKLYAYTLSNGDRDSSEEFNLHSSNGDPKDIWSDDTTIWVLDQDDDKLYAYTLSNGDRDTDEEWDLAAGFTGHGLWSDGETMWVSGIDGSLHDRAIASFRLSDGRRQDRRTYDLDAEGVGDAPQTDAVKGIWSIDGTMWVIGSEAQKIFSFNDDPRTARPTGRFPEHDLDNLQGARDLDPEGLFTDGTTLWMVDDKDDTIDAYNLSTGARDSGKDIDLHSHNSDPRGIWSNGTTMWVADISDNKLYAYNLSTGNRDTSKEFDLHTVTDPNHPDPRNNHRPEGIWSNGTFIWVADSRWDDLFAYNLSTGAVEFQLLINLDNDNKDPEGIWSDGTTMWVADDGDDKIYAYGLLSDERDEDKEFDTLRAAGNRDARGITSDGRTMWVADDGDDKIYAYNQAHRADDSTIGSITVNGAEVPGVRAGETPQFGVAHHVTQATITATANDVGADVSYDLADQDPHTPGHQIDLSQGTPGNSVTVTVIADDPGFSTDYVVKINRGYSDAYRWKAADDFDTLIVDDIVPDSLWSDGTTMWVLDSGDDKVYAYTLATRALDEDKDFDLHSSNGDAKGIWSNGTTMWVSDSADDKLYAYTLSNGNRDTDKEFNLHSSNGDPKDIWSNGTTMWVVDQDDDKLYAYTLDGGARDADKDLDLTSDEPAGFTGYGLWSDGTTMWVSGNEGHFSEVAIASFNLADGTRDTSRTYDLDVEGVDWVVGSLDHAKGIWSIGDTMWAIGNEQQKIFSFNHARSSYDQLGRFAENDFDTLVAAGNLNPTGIFTDGTTMWVADANTDGVFAYRLSSGARDSGKGQTLHADNTDPEGIWANETTMWVADDGDNKVYAYTLADKSRDTTEEWNLHADNTDPEGIWSDGVTMWVADDGDNKVYAYTLADKSRDTTEEWNLHADNSDPEGIWSDETTMWVADSGDNKVYAYTLSTKARDTAKEWNLHADNSDAEGIWSDGVTMWVADDGDDKLFAYTLADKARNSDLDFTMLSAAGNTDARGITAHGRTIWVADAEDDKIYAYNLKDRSTDAGVNAITVNGAEVPGLDPDRTERYAFGVAHDVARVTIAVTPNDSAASVTYSVDDADSATPGHQIDLSRGRNLLTVTVTAEAGSSRTRYNLRINRGYQGARRYKADDDFDSLIADGINPDDLWSDGTTMWVLDEGDDTLYAYTVSTKARDSSKDLDLHSSNGDARGIWSDGTTMWVSDSSDDKLFAYSLSTKARDIDKEWNFHSDNNNPRDIWSDETTIWVVDFTDDKVYAYTLSNGTRESDKDWDLNPTDNTNYFPYGIWSDGTTVWVSAAAGSIHSPQIQAYRLSDRTRNSRKDYSLGEAGINTSGIGSTENIRGLWSMDATMWVAALFDQKIFSFHSDLPRTLGDLTVSPRDIIGFDPGRTSYHVGVDSTVQQVTIAATAQDSRAAVEYPVADADPDTVGHQVDLSDGANEVIVEVTAFNATLSEYTVSVNRGVTSTFGWRAERDLDGLHAMPADPGANSRPAGVWTDGTNLWVLDSAGRRIYVYDRDGSYVADKSFAVSDTGTLAGLWSDGTTIWVPSSSGTALAYRLETGAADTSKDRTLHGDNGDPAGIWSNGEITWVPDADDGKLYAYSSSGGRLSSRDINATGPADPEPVGVWSDGLTAWVIHRGTTTVYAHDLRTGARKTSLDFSLAPGHDEPSGIAGDGATLWIAHDDSTGPGSKVFAYNLPASSNPDLATLRVDGTEVAGFDPGTTSYEVAVAATVRQVTVSAAVRQIGTVYEISPADADPDTDGHQAPLTQPVTPITVTVTAQTGATKTYTVNIANPAISSPPVVTARDATLDEDAAVGTVLGTVSARDPEGAAPLRWSLDRESSLLFEVVATNTDGTRAELRLKASLDFETAASHQVTVRATDPAPSNAVGEATVTVTVRNVNEAGTVTLVPTSPSLDTEMQAELSDPDGGITDVRWQWHQGDAATGPWTAIPDTDSSTYAPGESLLGKYLRATVSYTDTLGAGRSAEAVTSAPVVAYIEWHGYCRSAGPCDLTKAGRVSPGGRSFGQIDERYDEDLFRVELEEGKTYRIQVLAKGSGEGTLPDSLLTGMFAIFNGNGTLDDDGLVDDCGPRCGGDRMYPLWYDFDDAEHHPRRSFSDDDGGPGRDSWLFLKNFPPGVYYFMVRGVGGPQGTTGTYTVTFDEVADSEPAVTTIGELDVWQHGTLDFPGDEDVFEVTLEAGEAYTFVAERTKPRDGWHPYVARVEDLTTGTVRSLSSTPHRRQWATYTARSNGAHRITIDHGQYDDEYMRFGSYRIKVVDNLLARGGAAFSCRREVGGRCTASPWRLSDPDGLATPRGWTYQWYRHTKYRWRANPDQPESDIEFIEIPGATGRTYTIRRADAGHYLTVRISFFDADGNQEHVFGMLTKRVAEAPQQNNAGKSLRSAGSWSAQQLKPQSQLSAYSTDTRSGRTLRSAAIDPPLKPQNLEVSAATDTTVTLVWDDPRDKTVLGYEVLRRSRDGDTYGDGRGAAEFRVVAETDTPDTTYTDDTVTPRTRYVYRVRARNRAWLSEVASYVNAETLPANVAATGAPTVDGVARVGETLSVGTTGIADANGLDDVSFSYEWLADDDAIEGATGTSYTIADAELGKAITVRVTFADDDTHPETLTSEATSPVLVRLPSAPQNLAVSSQTHRTITLAWDDPGDSIVTGYEVLRRSRDGEAFGDGLGAADFEVLAEVGPSTFAYTDAGLPSRTRYAYAIRARSAGGPSELSGSVDAQTADQPANSAATGAPSLEGTAVERETLTAGVGSIADANGLAHASYSYQWLADGTAIDGATGTSYRLTKADVGKDITVRVSFVDDARHAESRTSRAMRPIQYNRPATGAPAIVGTPRHGDTLSVDLSGIADANGLERATFSYQWLADGTAIDGATGAEYTPGAAQLYTAITVRVSFTDDSNYPETRTSAATPGVKAIGDPPAQPQNLAVSKRTYRSVTLVWDDPGDSTIVGYQVLRRSIDGDTYGDALGAAEFVVVGRSSSPAPTYTDTTVTPRTRYIYRVKARNAGWLSEQSRFARAETPLRPANRAATGSPAIRGDTRTVRVGGTLTAHTTGIYDANGLEGVSFSFQWLADGAAIAGATGTSYTIAEADEGKALRVRVSFTDNDDYSETRTSAATKAALGSSDPPLQPQNLSVSAQTHRRVTLVWDDPGDSTIVGYQVLRRSVDGDTYGDALGAAEFVVVGRSSSPAPTYTDTTVTPRTRYIYRVKARNARGLSEVSRFARAETGQFVADQSPTGAPAITGTARHGETLRADTTGIADANGLDGVSFSYQWLADDVAIDGAGEAAYTLQKSDIGKAVKVRVTFTDNADYTETLTSAATRRVTVRWPSSPWGLQVWEGSGETVVLVWEQPGRGPVESYQVLRRTNGGPAEFEAVGETDSSLLLFTDDTVVASTRYIYRVRARNDGGLSGTSSALPFTTPAWSGNSRATGAPAITGTARHGETLSADTTGIADDDGLEDASFSYQWLADDLNIYGATGATYALQASDVGKTIKVRVSFTDDDGYSETRTSAGVGPVEHQLIQQEGNHSATGAPTIGGTARVGETLSVDTSGIADADGLEDATFSYQWLVDDAAVGVATGSSYALGTSDAGKTIKVRVSFTDDADSAERLTSAGVGPVERKPLANRAATGAPAVGGLVGAGETLTAVTSGIADADGLEDVSYSYQWLADDVAIVGATGVRYTLSDSDVGKTVKVRVSFTDDAGHTETLTSAATAPVVATLPDPPSQPQNLTVSSQTHNSVTLVWDDPGDSAIVGYQVLRRSRDAGEYGAGGGAPEFVPVGETSSAAVTYTDTTVTPRTRYVYRVKARNAGGLSEQSSYANAETLRRPANSAATGAPAIGGTAQAGQTLSVDLSAIADADGLDGVSYSYQWLADDNAVEGATGTTYTLGTADLARTLKVRVSFTDNAFHTETLTSEAAGPVGHPTSQQQTEQQQTEQQQTEQQQTEQQQTEQQQTNQPATGAPAVEGTVRVGETLSVDTTGIADADGLDGVSYSYQWLANDVAIEGATGATYTLETADLNKAITVRVSFTDNADNAETLTSRPLLTASAHDVPDNHDGQTAFTFELRFSEELSPDLDDFSYVTLRDHAFTVTGGTVTQVRRLEKPENGRNKNMRWEITVQPDTSGTVTVILPVTEDCNHQGAICTDDGRKLASPLELTVHHS